MIYRENDANAPRLQTDSLFFDPDRRYAYTTEADRLTRLVERTQLLDTSLWRLFVDQFRRTPDSDGGGDWLGWRCEFFGKLMRGGCFVYTYTKNETLLQCLTDAVRDMLATQDAQGRFSTYTKETEFSNWDVWGRKYVLLGLQYYLEICSDVTLCDEIIDAMKRHADYILCRVGAGEGQIPITATSRHWDGLNSSSLLEPIVRLYSITKETRYLDFAKHIVDCGGIQNGNLIELALEDACPPSRYPVTKAYEMMSFFEGVLEYYRVMGQALYRLATERFAHKIMTEEISVIGCAGCTHEIFDGAAVRQTDPTANTVMQETCVTVTWMKLCFQLLCLTGQSTYADEIERSAYNALFGAVNTEGVAARSSMSEIRYALPFDSYSPLRAGIRGAEVGGFMKMENGKAYGCCAAIAAAGLGVFQNGSVLTSRRGLALCFYQNGTVDTRLWDGTAVTLAIETSYPADGKIVLKVFPEKESAFSLLLRVPAFSQKTTVSVNGEALFPCASGFLEISRLWKKGDTVTLTLDVSLRVQQQNGYVCFLHGPLVLAADARCGVDVEAPVAIIAGNKIEASSYSPSFSAMLARKIRLADGTQLPLVSYADAGKTWSEDSKMAAWLKRKA